MALLDPRMHLAGQQVDPGEQAQCAMTFVFMVTCKALMLAGLWRQVGCGVGDRLDALCGRPPRVNLRIPVIMNTLPRRPERGLERHAAMAGRHD